MGARRSFSMASFSVSCDKSRCNGFRSAFGCCCDGIGGGSGGDGVDDAGCLVPLALTRIGVDSFESRDIFDEDVGVSGTEQLVSIKWNTNGTINLIRLRLSVS